MMFLNSETDIDDFCAKALSGLAELKKIISECDETFEVLENSIYMLKIRFPKYCECAAEIGNPSVIESFIVDIANENNFNPIFLKQIRQIVAFLQTQTLNNPEFDRLWSFLNEQLNQMDKKFEMNSDA